MVTSADSCGPVQNIVSDMHLCVALGSRWHLAGTLWDSSLDPQSLCPHLKATCPSAPRRLRFIDIMEVQVGTYTKQHYGRQHVVNEFPEFRLQVTLSVPEYQH